MIGNISEYDDIAGNGKIQPKESNHQHDFQIEAWFYSTNLPEVGMEVEFVLEGGRVSYLTEKTEKPLLEKLNEEKKRRKDDRKEEENAEEFVVKDENPFPDLGINEISLKYSIEECINKFFDSYLKKIEQNNTLLSRSKTMDYFLMRRFFITAYNNVSSMDSRVGGNKRLKEILGEFDSIGTMYRTLVKYAKMDTRYVYEKIFLKFQPEYVKVLNSREIQKNDLDRAAKSEESLKLEISETEKKLTNNEGNREELEARLKNLRAKYADAVQGISDCRKKIDYLNKMLSEFEERFADDFLEINKNFTKDMGKKLVKILDALAFEFDYTLWDNAKQSVIIRQKFSEANIEGSYCSKTFLKYYLKHLDETKLSELNQSLVLLSERLEKEYEKQALVCCHDAHYAQNLKQSLEFMSKDTKFRYLGTPKEVLNWVVRHEPESVVITYQMRQANARDLIRSIKKYKPDLFTDFYVILRPSDGDQHKRLKAIGVKYIFVESVEDGGFELLIKEMAKYL